MEVEAVKLMQYFYGLPDKGVSKGRGQLATLDLLGNPRKVQGIIENHRED